MNTLITTVTLISAAFVLYASFCRLSKTSHRVMTSVRFGIFMLAAASLVTLSAPLLWGWTPDAIHAAVFLGVAAHQVATRRTWAHGVPHLYLRSEPWPRH